MQKLPIKTSCRVCGAPVKLVPKISMENIRKGWAKCPICESITTCNSSGEHIETDPIGDAEMIPEILFIDDKIKVIVDYKPLQKRIFKLASLFHKYTFK